MPDRTLSELQKDCYTIAHSKGWWPENQERNVPELLMLAVTELGEAMEEYRAGRGLTEVYYRDDGKPEGFAVELADCIIRILDMAERHGISMQEAVEMKMAYNRTRPYRHGGKVA